MSLRRDDKRHPLSLFAYIPRAAAISVSRTRSWGALGWVALIGNITSYVTTQISRPRLLLRIIAARVRALRQPVSNIILGTDEIKRQHEHVHTPSRTRRGLEEFFLCSLQTSRSAMHSFNVFLPYIYIFAQISSQTPFVEKKAR